MNTKEKEGQPRYVHRHRLGFASLVDGATASSRQSAAVVVCRVASAPTSVCEPAHLDESPAMPPFAAALPQAPLSSLL